MAWQSSSTSLLFKRPHIKDSYFSNSWLALWKTASHRKQLQARDNILKAVFEVTRRRQRQKKTWEDSLLKEGNLTGCGLWFYKYCPESTWCWEVRSQAEDLDLMLEVVGNQMGGYPSFSPVISREAAPNLFIRSPQKLGWPFNCTFSGKITRCPLKTNRFSAEKSLQNISATAQCKRYKV